MNMDFSEYSLSDIDRTLDLLIPIATHLDDHDGALQLLMEKQRRIFNDQNEIEE